MEEQKIKEVLLASASNIRDNKNKTINFPDTSYKPLLSVIVPIYNVAPYVRKCLDSLKNQTMKKIEVVMVDDGSTDASGKIAEKYITEAGQWPEFRLIRHEKNRGLSAARNTGIDESISQWIMFVDSDDWVDERFCEMPYNAALENKSDLVIFGADTAKRNKVYRMITDSIVGEVDELTAHEYGSVMAWNKLYKRKLWETIRYPEGRTFEDMAITHKIVHVAKSIFFLQNCLYHNVSRKDSITHINTALNRRDKAINAFERCTDLISYGYSEEKLQGSLCEAAIRVLANVGDVNLCLKAKYVLDHCKKPEGLNKKMRIAYTAWKIDERLFYFICGITGRTKMM